MADILIRGMEMPEKNNYCKIYLYRDKDGTLSVHSMKTGMQIGVAVPLPAGHGRLIDADEISGSLAESATFNYNKRTSVCWSDAFLSMIDMLDDAPTIVPAEGGTDDVRCL